MPKVMPVFKILFDGVINSCIFQLENQIETKRWRIESRYKRFQGAKMFLLVWMVSRIRIYDQLRIRNDLMPFFHVELYLIVGSERQNRRMQSFDKIRRCA